MIAGGGTGGHLFPGVAIAGEFERRLGELQVVFFGARRGLETKVVPGLGYDLITLPVRGVVGHGFMGGLGRSVSLLWAAVEAFWILGRVKPDLVIGVGGYASVPAVLAAAARGLPRAILEQNVSPGRANRVLARFAQRIYQGFASRSAVFPAEKTVVTGNPIRPGVLPPDDMVRPDGRRTLLVLGGSQGAKQINDLVVGVAGRLKEKHPAVRVIHQTGAAHEEQVLEAYRRSGTEVEVVPFIDSMADAYARADLCLSRAGAMAISEIAAAGLPAVLIPYPDSAGGHQSSNARWLEERGAAVVIPPEEAGTDRLFQVLDRLVGSPSLLADMARASSRAGVRNAAERIVEEEMKRLGIGNREEAVDTDGGRC